MDLILGSNSTVVTAGSSCISCFGCLSLDRIIVLMEYSPELLDAFEDMNTNSTILMCGLQNPIVATNEVTLRHYETRGMLSE